MSRGNSWDALAWASRQKVGNVGAKFVLTQLAKRVDESWSCFPGQETLAEETEQSIRTVRDQLKKLEELGLIVRQSRGRQGGGRTSDRYVLMVEGKPADFAGKGKPADENTETGSGSPVSTGSQLPGNSQGEQSGTEQSGNGAADAGAALFEVQAAPEAKKKPGKQPDPANVAAKYLADGWDKLKGGMANYLAARGVLAKAVKAGHQVDAIKAALLRLHEANVPLTAASLDTELRGGLGSGRKSAYRPYKDAEHWGAEQQGSEVAADGWA